MWSEIIKTFFYNLAFNLDNSPFQTKFEQHIITM